MIRRRIRKSVPCRARRPWPGVSAATLLLCVLAPGWGLDAKGQEQLEEAREGAPAVQGVVDFQVAPDVRRLEFSPTAVAEPFLGIELFPPLRDRRPGNAVVWFGKVKAEQNAFFGNPEIQTKIAEWVDKPLDELRGEPRPLMTPESAPFYYLKRSAYSMQCDWQLPVHDGEYVSILLPDVQEARTYARLLAGIARWQIAHGDYDGAIETLRIGYGLGSKVAEAPAFVCTLVGIAIHGIMHEQLLEMMQQPDAPNLYWALTALPRPLVDPRLGLDGEFDAMELSIGRALNAEGRDNDSAWWTERVREIEVMNELFETGRDSRPRSYPIIEAVEAINRNLAEYQRSKEVLIDLGWDAAEVEEMPMGRVMVLANWHVYRVGRDRMMRTLYLSHRERMKYVSRDHEELSALPELGLIHKDLVLVGPVVHEVLLRQERDVALLRTYAAVQAHAAANEGRLPETLDEITVVPIPLHPGTGEPFEYELNGESATIRDPSITRKPIEVIINVRPN